MSELIYKAKLNEYNVFVYEHRRAKNTPVFPVVYYNDKLHSPDDTTGLGKFESESRAREEALAFLVRVSGGTIL